MLPPIIYIRAQGRQQAQVPTAVANQTMTRRRERAKAQHTMNKPLQATAPVETSAASPAGSTAEKDEALSQLGKFFYSLASLTYGGAVLTTLLDYKVDKTMTLLFASWATIALAVLGHTFVKRSNPVSKKTK